MGYINGTCPTVSVLVRIFTFGRYTYPVEVAGQLLRNVSLPSGGQSNRHNEGGAVGHTY